jgi:predicted MFS family arabinose efflux permease
LLPVFARDILQVGVSGLGLLSASAGFGAVLGAFSVTLLSRGRRGTVIVLLMVVLSLFAAGFAFSRTFWLSCVMLALASGGVATLKILGITLVHVHLRDELRGRVTSVLSLTLGATPRVGGLVAGFLASRSSASFALGFGALGCLVCGLLALVAAPWIRKLA